MSLISIISIVDGNALLNPPCQSEFNYETDIKLEKEQLQKARLSANSSQYLEFELHPRFINCSFNEAGRRNASRSRRTLETCDLIFNCIILSRWSLLSRMCRNCSAQPAALEADSARASRTSDTSISVNQRPNAWYIHSIKNEAVREELEHQLEEFG